MDLITGAKLWLLFKPLKRWKQWRNRRRVRQGKTLLDTDPTEGEMDKAQGIIRHILTTFGGVLVTGGYVTEGQLEILAGAVAILVGMAWSYWSKRDAA